jgi:hypothetical protein
MAVSNSKKFALVLCIVAAALGLLLAIHFSSDVLVMLDKCLAQCQIHQTRAMG